MLTVTGGCGDKAVAVCAATWPSVQPHFGVGVGLEEGATGLATAQAVAMHPSRQRATSGRVEMVEQSA